MCAKQSVQTFVGASCSARSSTLRPYAAGRRGRRRSRCGSAPGSRPIPHIDFAARLAWWRERWRSELVPACAITVAIEGEAVTGEAMAGFVTVDPRTGYLDQLVVAPEAWGTGAAARARSPLPRRSRPSGLDLHVNRDNARAIRFYEKHGFAVSGEETNPRSGAPVYRMSWRGERRGAAGTVGGQRRAFAPCPRGSAWPGWSRPHYRCGSADVGTRSLSSGRPRAGPVGFAHPTKLDPAYFYDAGAVDCPVACEPHRDQVLEPEAIGTNACGIHSGMSAAWLRWSNSASISIAGQPSTISATQTTIMVRSASTSRPCRHARRERLQQDVHAQLLALVADDAVAEKYDADEEEQHHLLGRGDRRGEHVAADDVGEVERHRDEQQHRGQRLDEGQRARRSNPPPERSRCCRLPSSAPHITSCASPRRRAGPIAA